LALHGEAIYMGESFLIVTERPVGGTERCGGGGIGIVGIGEALTGCLPVGVKGRPGRAPMSYLDALAREAGVRPLMEYFSDDSESYRWRFSAEGGGEPPLGGPPLERWFTAAEGLATVRDCWIM
jgi:hypothetical protein